MALPKVTKEPYPLPEAVQAIKGGWAAIAEWRMNQIRSDGPGMNPELAAKVEYAKNIQEHVAMELKNLKKLINDCSTTIGAVKR
jgi:hypothetical protein